MNTRQARIACVFDPGGTDRFCQTLTVNTPISFHDALTVAYMSPEQIRADLDALGTCSRAEKFWRYPGSRSVNAVL
jgi:hypothetical protein